MPVKPVPQGFHTVTPYVVVKGVGKVIDFVKATFDAKEIERHARPDGVVAHAEVQIGDSRVMMGDPTGSPHGDDSRPATLYVYVPDVDAAFKRAVAAGAKVVAPPADQLYGDRHGGVVDACGNMWWIATHVEDVSPEEMKRRSEKHMKEQHEG